MARKMKSSSCCRLDGCDESVHARDLCSRHYRYALAHDGDPGPARRHRAPWGKGNLKGSGYRVLGDHAHPLANKHGKVYEHRAVLFAKIGPGEHRCHWCGCAVVWKPVEGQVALVADHLDECKSNNAPDNLVPACAVCNLARGVRELVPFMVGV